ncbi:hypothetical protein BDR07DRAFT_1384545 [Suillus spraguei]|nr:hypothetical protein BDR07DRAFT_1384545 [Suillus spraguei]
MVRWRIAKEQWCKGPDADDESKRHRQSLPKLAQCGNVVMSGSQQSLVQADRGKAAVKVAVAAVVLWHVQCDELKELYRGNIASGNRWVMVILADCAVSARWSSEDGNVMCEVARMIAGAEVAENDKWQTISVCGAKCGKGPSAVQSVSKCLHVQVQVPVIVHLVPKVNGNIYNAAVKNGRGVLPPHSKEKVYGT